MARSTKAAAKGTTNLTPVATYEDQLKADFRKFMFVVWKHINLPDPTPLQYDIAYWLQHGPNKACIQAFRGVGKSFVTAAYVLWELLRNPQLKILVISASKSRADNFSTFCQRLIEEMPLLAHLKAKPGQRWSRIEFDVGPATADQSPSVKSAGITGQITGSRADIIIADDVEIANNSATADMREKLLERIKEFSAILKPLPTAKVIYLGTPQTEDSIYNKLAHTFKRRIWPSEVPTTDEHEKYGEDLAPFVVDLIGKRPAGAPTDPRRFSADDLAERKAEYGKAGYALQFMLNTQLSDLERFPLKIRDLIIMDTQSSEAPMKVNWLPDMKTEWKNLVNLAMAGDRYYGPASFDPAFKEYTGTVMAIDPSGRGQDETGYAVVKMLNGYLFVRRCGGLPGGYDNATLTQLAEIAKAEKVNHIVIEANFGDGMYSALFKPVLSAIHPCIVEEVKHSVQKERRIIDTLEPVMARHKLIFDKKVIEDDYTTAQKYESENKYTKTLIHQMTRISYDKGALKHDDRLDALAIAVAYWTTKVGIDEDEGVKAERDRLFDLELDKFMDHVLSRSGGSRQTWHTIPGR